VDQSGVLGLTKWQESEIKEQGMATRKKRSGNAIVHTIEEKRIYQNGSAAFQKLCAFGNVYLVTTKATEAHRRVLLPEISCNADTLSANGRVYSPAPPISPTSMSKPIRMFTKSTGVFTETQNHRIETSQPSLIGNNNPSSHLSKAEVAGSPVLVVLHYTPPAS
jgi:hypothetical protein